MRQRIAFLLIMVLLVSGLSGNMSVIYAADEAMEPFSIDYTEEGYSVVTEVTEVWNNGYNIRITIHNTSDEIIHNWGILLETKDEIHDLYNAQELSNEEGIRLFRNNVYNQDIPAGGSVMFGYTGYYTEEMDVPEEYAVSSFETAVDCEAFAVNYIMCDSWDGGAIAQILIENTSDKAIEDWMLEFDSGIEIAEIWDAELVSHVGGHYVIRNVPYQHNIMAGGMVVAGMRLLEAPDTDGEEEILTNVVVREILPDGSGQGNSGEGESSVSDNEVPGQGEDVSGNVVPDEDIVHLETGDGAGEIYYKTAYSDDVVSDPIGLPCIRNQFLLSADDTVSFRDVEDYLSGLGAVIVGYIEATNDYQVEMIEDTDVDAIQELTERISNEAWVRYAGFNYLWLEEPCFSTTDPWTEGNDTNIGVLHTSNPNGNNWGLEAIDFEGALINAGVISSNQASANDIRTDHLTTVRMGIYDSSFDEWHEDLADNFVMTWLNYRSQDELMEKYLNAEAQDDELKPYYHGTHVAGTMCAGFNNGIGINGICIKNELYGFAASTSYKDVLVNTHNVANTTFYTACGFSALITQEVKVINYSMGLVGGIAFAASAGEEGKKNSVIEYLDRQSLYMEGILNELLEQGYDFLIVVSAGNGNGKTYLSCNAISPYIGGYISEADAEREKSNDDNDNENNSKLEVHYEVSYNAVGIVEAKYNSIFSYIPDTEWCYDHILCVGSISWLNQNGSYSVSSFSNIGDRVDIYAPGTYIYSSYLTGRAGSSSMASADDCNYTRLNGTSMAAPHVSGTAGLAYNVNPNLSAAELKDMIINNAIHIQDANTRADIMVLNAADVIAAAIGKEPEYQVMLHITNNSGESVPDAIIEVREVDGWDFIFRGYTYYTFPAAGDDVICGELLSDESGFIRLRLPEGEYCAVIYSDAGVSNYIFSVDPENEANNVSHEVVLESQNPADSYMATMQFKQSGVTQLGNIEVCFRPGWNQSTGDCYSDMNGNSTFGLGSYGFIRVNLPPGMYTAEIYRDGVLWGYSNIIPGFNYVYRIY